MKSYKYIFLVVNYFLISNTVLTQEAFKQQEIGITFNNLDNFGLLYRFGNPTALWQLNAMTIFGLYGAEEYNTEGLGENISSFSMAVEIGREYRKKIAAPIELRLGAGLSFGFANMQLERQSRRYEELEISQKRYQPGLYFVLGGNYIINDRIILGAELLPNFSFQYSRNKEIKETTSGEIIETETVSKGFNYGLNTKTIRLSLAYRFIKN